MTNAYAYWQGKLAGLDPDPPADRTQMPCGFWRMPASRNHLNGAPLACWISEAGERVALLGFEGATALLSARRMEAIAEQGGFGSAITEEAYRAAFAAGRWADEPPPVPRSATSDGEARPNTPSDPAEALKIELEGEAELAAEFLARPIVSQTEADKAASWARRVGDLGKRADEARDAEKRPHLDAGRAVDDKFRPIISEAKDLATRLKRHVEPFLIEKKRQEDEARRRREEEARKAREEAERLARAAADDEEARQQAAAAVHRAQEAERAAQRTVSTNAGRTGAKVSLRTERRARIVDYSAALTALADHPEMRAFVETLANRAVRAGVQLAGVEVEEFQKAA